MNTSAREGLPSSFIEAAGHGCALLSGVNPDNFASEFGFWAGNDDFEKGLEFLLQGNRWRKRGAAGFDYACRTYNDNRALETHHRIYLNVLGKEAT